MIDVHTHLGIGGTVRANALADLGAGFTTVADQGARTERIIALKDSINAFGTDGGVLPHGAGVEELEALVAAGLTPIKVVRAATTNAARALAIADTVGQVAAGMSADFVAVAGDPLAKLSALRNPRLVIAKGRVIVEP
jgi:imidazolonepropionase-like amidohydrolase